MLHQYFGQSLIVSNPRLIVKSFSLTQKNDFGQPLFHVDKGSTTQKDLSKTTECKDCI